MLYHEVKNFAAGHGTAVTWDVSEKNDVSLIKTDFLPIYNVLQMKPSAMFSHPILSMKYISDATKEKVIDGIKNFITLYEKWIQENEEQVSTLSRQYDEVARENISKCIDTKNRIQNSIKCFEKDEDAFMSFKLANRAMYMQRKQMFINNGIDKSDDEITWYPFQLAFFLQEIASFTYPDSIERKNVDLLWFPTGGGKTEAYLGIAAFSIFLRRIRNEKLDKGVVVIMRYTLRLLSFQQFERASALICACEIIRQEIGMQGNPFGIGLWAGIDLTPNKLSKAKIILNGGSDEQHPSSNPAQLKKCPWCGSKIEKNHYTVDIAMKRMIVKCPSIKCKFKEGLPVYMIDEEIYAHKPTYIIGTVDKFAQLASNVQSGAIIGAEDGCIPPELIIQDELHLISGPLGTITGIYEAAISKICERNSVRPKVIASTATIRNAKEQIKALYAAEYTQFPPQGININNSFFAEISTEEEKPARKYMGCMAIGTSPTTMMIRVMSSMLFATRYLLELGYNEKVIDSFWTLTGYFNTLRELGGAIVRIVDDIQDRYLYLKKSKFSNKYPMIKAKQRYDNLKELTSRASGEDIGEVIQTELKIPYKEDGSTTPFDFLLASNMISVGVDVGRLGCMVVVGQPMKTTEYIQATSRVGRETPGLVVTTYNQSKSRDRSHYEQFTQYHETFYKFVEATSLTPFSDRARDRALQALYIILCRYLVPQLRENAQAVNFRKSMHELIPIRKYIYDYVQIVDSDECDNVMDEIDEIESMWEIRSLRAKELKYMDYLKTEKTLFDPDYKEDSRFRIMNSMRSVETTVNVTTEE